MVHSVDEVVPRRSLGARTGPPFTSANASAVITRRTSDAAAPYRLDPIECCSTLTGLRETYAFIYARSPPGLVSGTRGNACEQEPDKSASRNIHATRRRQAKATSVHRDERPAFCARRWWNAAAVAASRPNNRRERRSSAFQGLTAFFNAALGYSRGVACYVTLGLSLITGSALPPPSSGRRLNVFSLCLAAILLSLGCRAFWIGT